MSPWDTALRASAVSAVLATSVLLAGCVSTVSGTGVRAQGAGPHDVPPLTAAQLDDVLLSIGELNGIMGATRMKVTSELEEMTDHSDAVADRECLGAIYGAEEPVYAGSGWTDVRDQVAREPDADNDHWVEQTAVLYSSAEDAARFFDDSRSAWEGCANSTVTVGSSGSSHLWEFDEVHTEDRLITQIATQTDADGWACQHALSAASNLSVETWACSYSIGDEAATIARDMLANAAK
ncbi:sensor domain-containing protein [Mycolicibacterium sp. GF69]|uniref:sensor domain-containing protein n=1 Tax=Mycolicibacterium sp. GF69 TaxID=2267251 RepID=UPI000DCE737F|nr:sensor domain-containing protein [Mycolicibacterium sp. GF69]RAV12769.1 sensor domain-containing protein [Mycolicibacterium sp. GF69]